MSQRVKGTSTLNGVRSGFVPSRHPEMSLQNGVPGKWDAIYGEAVRICTDKAARLECHGVGTRIEPGAMDVFRD
jgi:hypothetical protein